MKPALILALCSLALADIAFIQPSVGTIWNAGSNGVINWKSATASPLSSSPLILNLMYGGMSFPQYVGAIATIEDAMQVTIKVPSSLPSGNQYSIQTNGTSSALFTIQNDKMPPGSNAIPTNVTLVVVSTGGSSSSAVRVGASLGCVFSSLLFTII